MSLYSEIHSNKQKTYLIMAIFISFVALLGYIYGEATGYGLSYAGIALIFSGFVSFGSYYFGDKLVLSMSHARPADPTRDFDFYTVSENLCIAAGIPKPKLYVIEDTALNAFATGRDPEHAVVVATSGLLSTLERAELEGVIAHELSHVKNYDIRLMSIVAVLVGTIAFLADMFMRSMWRGGDRKKGGGVFILLGVFFAILSPIMATLIQLALSRRREYLADASAAMLTRHPEGLARALEKIAGDKEVLEAASNATAHLYISNPFKDKQYSAWFAGLFNTHPPIAERIKILRSV